MKSKQTIQTRKYSILIVDDNPNNLFTLRTALEASLDVDVIESTSGEAALEKVVSRKIDLLLLDIRMPGMNGFEVAKLIRNRKMYQDIPIIFLTAVYKSDEFKQEGLETGAIDYLTKPIDDMILINRVKAYFRVIENERALNRKLEQINKQLQQKIEEQRQTEKKLQQTMLELKRSNTDLEQFAYVASHDLQEPLRKIQAFGSQLMSRYATVMDERGRDYLQRMENAARRIRQLIDDLLAFSRVTTKANPFAPVDLAEVAQEVILDLEAFTQKQVGFDRIPVCKLHLFPFNRCQITHRRCQVAKSGLQSELLIFDFSNKETPIIQTNLRSIRSCC